MEMFARVLDDNGDVMLVNMKYIKSIRRIDRPERNDVLEDVKGHYFECAPEDGSTSYINALIEVAGGD